MEQINSVLSLVGNLAGQNIVTLIIIGVLTIAYIVFMIISRPKPPGEGEQSSALQQNVTQETNQANSDILNSLNQLGGKK